MPAISSNFLHSLLNDVIKHILEFIDTLVHLFLLQSCSIRYFESRALISTLYEYFTIYLPSIY